MRTRAGSTYIEKVLNVWAIVLILWSVYRVTFKTDLPIWFDEFIAKPLIFLLPVIMFIRKAEEKRFFTGVSLKKSKIGKEILIGLALGMIFFIAGAIGIFIRQNNFIFDIGNLFQGKNIFYFALIASATSISEEILSRGFVLKRLYQQSRNIYSSSFFASVLFFLLHVPILFTSSQMTGGLLLQVMVADMVLSLAVSFLFLRRKSLVSPIIVHALYSLSLYLFI